MPKKTEKKTSPRKTQQTPKDIARIAAQAAYDIKGENIVVLDLEELSGFSDFFVIVSGRSDRQVQAIAENVQKVFKEQYQRFPIGVEGEQQGHWVLIDYGSVVVHVFYEEVREFYALEKLWGDAKKVNLRLK